MEQIDMYHIFMYIKTHIYTRHKTERVFMTKSFIFHIQDKSFHDRFISLVQYQKVLQHMVLFPFYTSQY